MERIAAMPTRYDGHDFRSRLEARWAVVWNYADGKYDFEPGYFDLGFGIRYAPDFLLHDVRGRFDGDLYVEVKGVLTERDKYKIERCPAPIIVVGAIPDPIDFRAEMSRRFYETDGVMYSCMGFDGDYFGAVIGVGRDGGIWIDDENFNHDGISTEKTRNAFMTARMAVFEGRGADAKFHMRSEFSPPHEKPSCAVKCPLHEYVFSCEGCEHEHDQQCDFGVEIGWNGDGTVGLYPNYQFSKYEKGKE